MSSDVTDTDVRRIEDKVDGLALTLARLEGSLSPTLDKLTERQNDADDRLDDVEARTAKRFDEIEERMNERLEDHEERVRGLERFRHAVPSLAVISLLCSIGVAIYYATGHP